MNLPKWPLFVLLVVIALMIFGIIVSERDRRRDMGERAIRDSLAVERSRAQQWQRTAQERGERYLEAKVTLENLLAQPPRVVQVTRVRVDTLTGTTDTSEVPYVPQADFDTLARRCRDAVASCDSVLAAKDSVIAHDSARLTLTGTLLTRAERQLTRERRGGWLRTVRDVALGVIACRVACPR
jgi:hypothetical protein